MAVPFTPQRAPPWTSLRLMPWHLAWSSDECRHAVAGPIILYRVQRSRQGLGVRLMKPRGWCQARFRIVRVNGEYTLYVTRPVLQKGSTNKCPLFFARCDDSVRHDMCLIGRVQIWKHYILMYIHKYVCMYVSLHRPKLGGPAASAVEICGLPRIVSSV